MPKNRRGGGCLFDSTVMVRYPRDLVALPSKGPMLVYVRVLRVAENTRDGSGGFYLTLH